MSPCELCGGTGNFCSNCDLYKGEYIKKSVLEDIKTEIEDKVLESLSDCGEDWFAAGKVNECMEIIDKHCGKG